MFRLKSVKEIASMQRKIDAYEEVLSRILSYIINPNGFNEDSPAGLTHEINDAKYIFRFLLWIKLNQPDIFERFLNNKFGNKPDNDSKCE